jgi:DNA-binding GntR family transcriptional regulator
MPEPLVRKEVLRDKIHDVLRGWILDGTLKPGERIVELTLSRRLSVSRAPFREALWLLAHQGLVRIHPHRGAFVTKLTPGDIREIFEIRELLETRAALRVRERLDASGRRVLQEAYAALERAAQDRDMTRFSTADLEFHRALWRLSGNRHLEEVLGEISSRFFGYELIRDQPHGRHFRFPEMLEEHRELLRLVLEGSPGEIEAGFRRSFASFLAYVLERFEAPSGH